MLACLLLVGWPRLAAAEDEVVVHGADVVAATRDEAAASSLIRRRSLGGAGESAADVLRRQTSIGITETGGYGAPSTAAIRGATSGQTSVFLAGLRLNDDLTGAADLSLVPLWMVGRIEVYRGAVPLEADPWGIGGAIFIDPRVPVRTEAAVSSTVGSFGTRALEGRIGLGDERVAVLFGIRAAGARNNYGFVDDRGTRFDASDDREERRRNADVDELDMWALGRMRIGERTRASVTSNEFVREQGIAGLAVAGARAVRARTRRSLHGLEFTTECGKGCTFTGASGLLLTTSSYHDPLLELLGGPHRMTLDGRRGEVSGRFEFRRGIFEAGAHMRVSRESLTTSSVAIDREEQRRGRSGARIAASGGIRHPAFGRAVVMGALERQATSDGVDDTERLYPAVRVAASRTAGPASLLLNVGSYFRAPTLGELYGFSGVVQGNSGLRPERGASADVGVRLGGLRPIGWPSARTDVRVALAAFLFGRTSHDLVAFRRSSLGYVTPYNLGSARVFGAEVESSLDFGSSLSLGAGLTLFDGRDLGRNAGNDLLPFRSRLKSSLSAESRFDGPLALGAKRTTVTVTHVYESSRYADPEGLVVIPEQSMLDATVRVLLLGDHASFEVRVKNVLGSSRFDTVGFVLPERAVFLGMEVFL